MARTGPNPAHNGDDFPATARLRAELLIAPDLESLVALFSRALDEHGVSGHFCLRKNGAVFTPVVGDSPELIAAQRDCLIVDNPDGFVTDTRVLLARPSMELGRQQMTRLTGYAQLYAARALALQELADDVETDCGLTLRERYVLGRRLAGHAPVDIAIESGLAVETVSSAIDSAVRRLGAVNLADAIALAARRGWLAVTNLENCSSSSGKLSYKATQSGF